MNTIHTPLARLTILGLAALGFASIAGCSGEFHQLGSSLLSSTGMVSSSEADSLMTAGEGISKSMRSLSEEEEYYIGRGVAATILSKYRPYRNPEVTAYVNKVAMVVAGVSDRPETFGGYHVQVLDSNEINAVSGPGGFIFVTTGFLKIVPNEEALAAVLAHEVGHIVKGHGLSAISQANLSQALLLLGKQAAESRGGATVSALTTTFGDSVTDIANTILTKGYSRSQEYEADAYGAALLKRSGYNPAGMVAMLEGVEKHQQGSAGGGWASTHPSPKDRESEIGSAAKSTPSAGETVRARRFEQVMKRLG